MTGPRTFESNDDWYEVTRRWPELSAAGDEASIAPGRVEAADAPLEWAVEYEVRDRPLGPGAHVALEVPIHFRLDHGRPYPVGRGHVEHVDTARVGYSIPVDVRTGGDVDVEFAVSNTNRFSVVDVAVTAGEIEPGETLEIVLGEESSSRMRAPKFAQEFLFACGVDRNGDGGYRPVDPFPAVTVTGAAPERFRLIAPSTVDPGEAFEVDLYPADRYSRNPAAEYDRRVELEGTGDVDLPASVDLGGGPEGWTLRDNETIPGDVYRVGGAALDGEGRGRVRALDRERALAGRSNPVAAGWSDRDVFWGEIHFQGYDSIGVGTTEEMFEWGRDVEGLDFCGMASHYGGRYPATPEHWSEFVEATNRFYEPGEFATLLSYEWGGAEGDKNVYYRGDEGEFYTAKGNEDSIVRRDGEWTAADRRYDTADELWAELDADGGDALTIPHHPKTAAFGTVDWDAFHNEYQRLVEIYSAWGDSEIGGPRSVRAGLDRGHRVGFTGGTDTHDGQPAHGPHEFNQGAGITAVYADELTREAIFDALYERRTYATTGPRILLDFEVNGMRLGGERPATADDRGSRTAAVRAIGTAEIEAIDLVRNGDVVATHEPGSERATVEWEDDAPLDDRLRSTDNPDGKRFAYYYARVRQADRHTAWASPVWFLEG